MSSPSHSTSSDLELVEQQPCSFLEKLPLEIRQRIYEFVCIYPKALDWDGPIYECHGIHIYRDLGEGVERDDMTCVPLFLVNKQIYHEANAIFRKGNTFKIRGQFFKGCIGSQYYSWNLPSLDGLRSLAIYHFGDGHCCLPEKGHACRTAIWSIFSELVESKGLDNIVLLSGNTYEVGEIVRVLLSLGSGTFLLKYPDVSTIHLQTAARSIKLRYIKDFYLYTPIWKPKLASGTLDDFLCKDEWRDNWWREYWRDAEDTDSPTVKRITRSPKTPKTPKVNLPFW